MIFGLNTTSDISNCYTKFHEPLDYKENQRVHLIEVLRRPIETKNELIRQIK